jgi:uncharacterized membrane protein
VPLGGSLVAGAIGLGGAIVKGIRARKQRKAAEKINPIRPEMVRTNASKENEAMFRGMANSNRLPGQAYAENQIGAQTARATNAIQQTGGSTGEIISGLTAVDENARKSTNDLAFQGAQLNQQNKQLFGQVLNNVSEEQKDIFDYNKNQPFQTETLRKQALLDASERNTDNAIDQATDVASNFGVAAGYAANEDVIGTKKKRKGGSPIYS